MSAAKQTAAKAKQAAEKRKRPRSKPKITGAEPQLLVNDIQRSCDFFRKKLGFEIVFTYGDPPFYAQVYRDAARINLSLAPEKVMNAVLRERNRLLSVSLTVATADEIKRLFREYDGVGVAFVQRLKKQPWGARNFVVKDPDGNLLLFAGPAE